MNKILSKGKKLTIRECADTYHKSRGKCPKKICRKIIRKTFLMTNKTINKVKKLKRMRSQHSRLRIQQRRAAVKGRPATMRRKRLAASWVHSSATY
jgi:hypothetical protein